MMYLFEPGTSQCRSKLCNEGRRLCPTPQACQVPEPDQAPRRCLPHSTERTHRVILGGVVLLLAVLGVVTLLAGVAR